MKAILIAQIAHEINRAYCESLGDDSQPSWESAPDWQKDSAVAGVEMHLANPDATPEQSHESWLFHKLADGWVHGEVKDAEAKTHPCCLPYEELPPEQKAKDYLFRAVVHQLKGIPDETTVVAAQEGPAPANTVGVKYIGRRKEWNDRMYQTGLNFVAGQVRFVPGNVAKKLLTHKDLFARVEGEKPVDQEDDTDSLLQSASKETDTTRDKLAEVQQLYDQIDQMDKAGLAKFAQENYRHEFKARDTKDHMQAECKRLIDQFGVV